MAPGQITADCEIQNSRQQKTRCPTYHRVKKSATSTTFF